MKTLHNTPETPPVHKASNLRKHIYIYSPSGAVKDKIAFKRGVKRLQKLGYEVELDAAALTTSSRFAGDDSTRIAAITRAAASGADIALISRGGYGLTRILPELPYAAITQAIAAGVEFVGFSDFTAFQTALLAKTGAISWAGAALCPDFGAIEPDDIMEACFDDLIQHQGEGAGWHMRKSDLPLSSADGSENGRQPENFEIENATLWGGNLSVLVSLIGTPYFPKIDQGVLFLEDVNEPPYRIERMLTQLLHAGILAQQQAIVLGQFTDYKLSAHDKGFKLSHVVNRLRNQLKIPVVLGLPFGHVATKVMLPVGAQVSLAVQGQDAMLFWGHGV